LLLLSKIMKTSFPDKKIIEKFALGLQNKVLPRLSPLEKILVFAGVAMNWQADFLLDETIKWRKKKLKLDDLYLTGTNPRWNAIVIDKCQRSPKKFRDYLLKNPAAKTIFKKAKFSLYPILVHHEDKKLKVFDGMNRVIASLREGKKEIEAWVATPNKKPKPKVEPHVIYDFLRSYHRGINKDRKGLIAALKFLRKSYSNVDQLLKERFNIDWVPSEEIQKIIRDSLK